MYSNEDLNLAVEEKIFSQESVNKFRAFVAQSHHTEAVDEENFRLLTGFNDIFVVISSILFLASVAFIGSYLVHPAVGAILQLALSWGLSEYFVNKRRMALPGIILLLSFAGSAFASAVAVFHLFFDNVLKMDYPFVVAGVVACAAAFIHWRRFRVPITIAAGVICAVVAISISLSNAYGISQDLFYTFILLCGFGTFLLAMTWDASDRDRVTRRSDVAFWLHLISAPMVVHPVFSKLGILGGDVSMAAAFIVIVLYFAMTVISIVIDRRAFMVSSLIYVVYAAFNLMKMTYGSNSLNLAVTGLIVGGSLLLLAVYWHRARMQLLKRAPQSIVDRVPIMKNLTLQA